MSIKVNQETCVGCGMCVNMCPDVFSLNEDNKAYAISQENTECAKNAASRCPVNAITVEE